MKKYRICLFFILLAVSIFVSSALGYAVGRQRGRSEAQFQQENWKTEQNKNQNQDQNHMIPETIPEDHEATNKDKIEAVSENEYYLVAEDGFLLVFLKDRKTICLYTHLPLTDFSLAEQEKLREGIWFSSMIEVFNYLESCSS